MTNDYATLSELQASMPGSGISSTDYESLLTDLLTRASRAIDRFTKRAPGAYAVTSSDEQTRYYDGSGSATQYLDEMAAAPSYVGVSEAGGVASTDYTTYPSTDYFIEPVNAPYEGMPYTHLVLDQLNGGKALWYSLSHSVKVTAAFAYALSTAIPDEIVQATIIQAARWFKRGQQAFQDTGAIAELGQLTYTQSLDPEVKAIIEHYRRTVL